MPSGLMNPLMMLTFSRANSESVFTLQRYIDAVTESGFKSYDGKPKKLLQDGTGLPGDTRGIPNKPPGKS